MRLYTDDLKRSILGRRSEEHIQTSLYVMARWTRGRTHEKGRRVAQAGPISNQKISRRKRTMDRSRVYLTCMGHRSWPGGRATYFWLFKEGLT
jgi:hypothetical protein